MLTPCARTTFWRRIRNLSLARQRHYYSYNYDLPPAFSSAEEAILSAAISHVPAQGFTATALTAGARDAGYLDASANLFPLGAFALVNYHLVTQRLALAKNNILPPVDAEKPSNTLARIRSIALNRLHANEPIIHQWQEALALLATPKHFPTSIRELALLSDEILFLAGDKSVDSSWYTKRAGLSAIYASTELFMTQDRSSGFTETEAFLDRRLQGAHALNSTASDVGQWLGVQGMGVVNGLRSKGVRI